MSKQFRALFVLPNFGRNGAVDFIIDLADAIAIQDVEVQILALQGAKHDARQPSDSVAVTTGMGDRSLRFRQALPVGRVRRILELVFLASKVMRSVLRSDVVILTWEHGDALRLPSLAAYILRKPTVALVQNNIQQSLTDYGDVSWLRFLRWSYERARAVVCVSKDQIPILQKVGVDQSKLVLIPNALNIERVRALSKELPPSTLPEDGIPYIVGVGRLAPQKGFDYLIRAHAEVIKRGVRHSLVLIGNGPDKEALRALANECGVSRSVLFLGYLPNPYPTIFQSSLYCLSSRYEGRPLVLSEAALLGVPMIAANCPTGPREILAGGLYGDLVETESVDALSAAVEKHLRDPQRLISKAQASARESDRFSIETCAQEYVSLISQHVR